MKGILAMRKACAILPCMLERCLSLAFVSLALGAQPVPSKNPPAGPVQPIPYSHKQHLALGLECKNCHEMLEPGDQMGLPTTAKCMSCHTAIKSDSPNIQKLAQFHKDGQPVPWVQVYHLPDFVDFSHKAHLTKGKATCENCHGPVRERDVIRKEMDTSMAGCMDCHRSKDASVACNFCHDPR
jgi:hypothetical protein